MSVLVPLLLQTHQPVQIVSYMRPIGFPKLQSHYLNQLRDPASSLKLNSMSMVVAKEMNSGKIYIHIKTNSA